MAQAPAALVAAVVVVVNSLADLLPESYSSDDKSVDIEECFGRFRQRLGLHQNRFGNNTESSSHKICLVRYSPAMVQ